jgi:hypothetical protein
MKNFFGVLALAFSLIVSVAMADTFGDAIKAAQDKKNAGDYLGAAQTTPRSLCSAIYYWNAACKVVGHKNASNDWVRNATLTDAQKAEGLRLLGLASSALEASKNKAGLTAPDDGTCTGVDPGDLAELIQKVKDAINQ